MREKKILTMKKGNRIQRLGVLAGMLLLAACLMIPGGALGEEKPLSVSVPADVRGFVTCQIRIQSPCAGEAVLRLYDSNNNLWLVMRETVDAGDNSIPWNGLGANLEKMFSGPYHFDVTVTGEDGTEYTATAKFNMSATKPALVYALPSSETLYLDGSEKWFVEYFVSAECMVDMEVRSGKKVIWTGNLKFTNPDGDIFSWKGKIGGGKTIAPGDYTLVFKSRPNPDYSFTWPLHVEEGPCPAYGIAETGPVMPERGMKDAEIWEIMMKPSVVIKTSGTMKQYDIYEKPTTESRVTGSLRGATQGLEILEAGERWSLVRAWTHTNGSECTGYIRTDQLEVVTPSTHYGLLIDKLDQTMTVYEDGKVIGRLPVSTGKPEPGNTYRETPAGAFLTHLHFGSSFAQEGYRYEYPIRYDSGNMIHNVGFTRTGRMRDFSDNMPLLGQKASHGCIRVSPFVTEDCDINIYWLWTHLPYHTRVIILDDAGADVLEVIDDEDQ